MTIASPVVAHQSECRNQSTNSVSNKWLNVCKLQDLVVNSGVCALIDNTQIAIFALTDSANNMRLYACDNYDPIGKANVLSRGILCSVAGEVCICSPLYKQHFSLVDGRCLEDANISIAVYQTQIEAGDVSLLMPLSPVR